ncbi:hypothetical protein BsWGS_28270 [Bradybaena similaris]
MNPFGRRPNSDNPSAPPQDGSWWDFPGKMGLTASIAKLARPAIVNLPGGRSNTDKTSAPPESKSGWRFWENRLPVTFGQTGGTDAVTASLKKNPPSKPDNLSAPPQDGSWWGIPGKMGLTASIAKLARPAIVNPPDGRPNSDKPSAPPESRSSWRFWENRLPVTFGQTGGTDAVTASLKKNPPSKPDNLSAPPQDGSWWGIPGKMGVTASIAKLARPAIVNPPDGRPSSDKPSAPPESRSSWRFWENRLPVTFGQTGGTDAVNAALKKNSPSDPDNLSAPPQSGSFWGIFGKMGLTASSVKLPSAPLVTPPGASVNNDGRPNPDISSGVAEGHPGWKSWVKGLPAKIGLSTGGNAVTEASIANRSAKSVISPTDNGRPNSDLPPEPSEGQSAWKTMEKGLPVALGVAAAGVAVAGAPLIIAGAGFGAKGIAAGSAAASIMSKAATAGVGMGGVSALQSAGAAGLAASTKILIGGTAGAAAAKIAGAALDKGNPQGGNPSGGDGKGNNLGGNVAGGHSKDNDPGENGGGDGSRGKDSGESGAKGEYSWYSGWGKYFRNKI